MVVDFLNNVDWVTLVLGTLLGCLISMLFNLIISFFKPHREKYHLSLSKRSEDRSYSSISGDDLSVCIQYKGVKYSGTLAIVTIALVNDGQNALSFVNHFDKPIFLKSKGYRIVDVKPVGGERVKAKAAINEGGIVSIEWGLLKKGEEIVVQLVGAREEIDNPRSFFDSLAFNVRSDCVDYISPKKVPFRKIALLSFLFFAVAGCINYWSLSKSDSSYKVYRFEKDNEITEGVLDYDSVMDVYTIMPSDSLNTENSIVDLKPHPRIVIFKPTNHLLLSVVEFLGMWILFLMIVFIVEFVEGRKKGKIEFEDADD